MKLQWDNVGERFYETGVDHAVLYPVVNNAYPVGYAWNGITSISESPSGAEDSAIYADNIKYLTLKSAEELGLTIEAYTYPDQWEACDGTEELATGVKIGQQNRQKFGLSYRTKVGNDSAGDSLGYKLHLVYGCSASPSERGYQSTNDSPEAISFSWSISTIPIPLNGHKPVSLITIDSRKVDSAKLTRLESILYGTDVDTYVEFEGETFEQGVTYYERSGSEGSYTYTATSDTEPQQGKTYYTKIAASDARLPLPDEVQSLFAQG